MGATFMKLGRAPTTLITLSIDYQQSFSKSLGDNFIPVEIKMLGYVAKNSGERAKFNWIVPRNCYVVFAEFSGR